MAEKLEIYKCEVCGNIVQVLKGGAGELVCCGEIMKHLDGQFEENELGEKHVPQIVTSHEGCETGICREVKKVTLEHHPMMPEHHIEFIEVYTKDKKDLRIKFFEPDEKPELEITNLEQTVFAFENCNIHGFWRGKND